MSNSANMTLEQKLVQHIKEIGLGALITDEDAITELTRKAIQEALFQRRTFRDGYSTREGDSPVVESARAVAAAAVQKVFDQQVKVLLENPETLKAINQAIVESLPTALTNALKELISFNTQNSSFKAVQTLTDNLRSRGINI